MFPVGWILGAIRDLTFAGTIPLITNLVHSVRYGHMSGGNKQMESIQPNIGRNG